MPRVTKYDDVPFEKVVFSTKFFMYCTPNWEILYPVVDIIRLLQKNSIIAIRCGKGQNIIKTYGMQYNHRVLNYDLKTKQNYLDLKCVKCIMLFSDKHDIVAENIITFSKTMEILLVCYSNLDNTYHLYNGNVKESIKSAEETLNRVYEIISQKDLSKLNGLFPEFEILSEPENKEETVLEKCIQKLKAVQLEEKKNQPHTKVIFDPHISKLKKMEYERSMKKVVYDDDIEKINKQHKINISKFFKK